MTRRSDYVKALSGARDRIRYLREHSGLPGPRANLELLEAAADAGDEKQFRQWMGTAAGEPTDEFVVACGVVGLGRLIAEGDASLAEELVAFAIDPRWRVREAVAIGLQRVGDANVNQLVSIISAWASARPFLQRAAAAAICEPRLLKTPAAAGAALRLLDRITRTMDARSPHPDPPPQGGRDKQVSRPPSGVEREERRVLRQAMGYSWSVAVAADPVSGRSAFERWTRSGDEDVRWILRENLKKHRLVSMDPEWVARMRKRLAQ